MIKDMDVCQNCGQINAQNSEFCRFCGERFYLSRSNNQVGFEYSPPRPYSWKTDEFEISDSNATEQNHSNRVETFSPPTPQKIFPPPPFSKQPLVAGHHYRLAHNFCCPRCGTNVMPRLERKISDVGWITFLILLLLCFPLFWIGFLIRENVAVCSVCNFQID